MFVLQYLNGGTDLYFNFTFLVAFAKIKFAQISTVYSLHEEFEFPFISIYMYFMILRIKKGVQEDK